MDSVEVWDDIRTIEYSTRFCDQRRYVTGSTRYGSKVVDQLTQIEATRRAVG